MTQTMNQLRKEILKTRAERLQITEQIRKIEGQLRQLRAEREALGENDDRKKLISKETTKFTRELREVQQKGDLLDRATSRLVSQYRDSVHLEITANVSEAVRQAIRELVVLSDLCNHSLRSTMLAAADMSNMSEEDRSAILDRLDGDGVLVPARTGT